MNQKERLEVLEAFAGSKPAEFEGFKIQWAKTHKPIVEQVVAEALPQQEFATAEVVMQEFKPKRRRRL